MLPAVAALIVLGGQEAGQWDLHSLNLPLPFVALGWGRDGELLDRDQAFSEELGEDIIGRHRRDWLLDGFFSGQRQLARDIEEFKH